MDGASRRSLGPQVQHTHSFEDHTWCILTSMFKTALNNNIIVIPHTWKLAKIVLIPRHRQGQLIHAHIPLLSNCKDIGEEPSSQFRKPSSPLKPKHQKYITSHQCAPIGCTRQEVGSLHSLETTSHSLQQTYLRLLIHTT